MGRSDSPLTKLALKRDCRLYAVSWLANKCCSCACGGYCVKAAMIGHSRGGNSDLCIGGIAP